MTQVTLARPAPIDTNDYHVLPASPKQLGFARKIAARTKAELPADVIEDRRRLSRWIDEHKARIPTSKFDAYPSAKQVAFAERLSRTKRRPIPQSCFRDKALMSRWIDSNR